MISGTKNTLLIGLGITIIAGLLSCKKDGTKLMTTEDNLVGSWELSSQGSNINNNKLFDPNEKNTVSDTVIFTYQLIKGGSGYKVGYNNTYVDTVAWKLVNNESDVQITVYNQGFSKRSTYKYSYNSSSLTLMDDEVSPAFFRHFSRKN